MTSADRAYFSRRSVEEICAAMRADCTEAASAHISLAEMHLAQCAACGSSTEECGHCLAVNICLRRESVRDSIREMRIRPGPPDGLHARATAQDLQIMPSPAAALSPEETEILQCIARGLSAREVGDTIGATPRQVERRIDHMRAKLNARNSAHLITRAIIGGLLDLPN